MFLFFYKLTSNKNNKTIKNDNANKNIIFIVKENEWI